MPLPTAPPAIVPVDLGKPVEAGVLSDINPESIGLLSTSEGGLGAAMWKGTPRDLVEHLLPALTLPSFSPTLNNLAQRFLLTTADVPEGKPGEGPDIISLRISDLVALGDVNDAWKLVALAKPEQIDDTTMRKVAEAALLSSESADVCAKLPDIIKNRPKADWQELLLVCQLIAKDTKAAQVTLDLMRSQDIRNDILLSIADRNIISGAKELPRQLTPLKPLTLALLKLSDLPLRSEVYAHPDAALIPTLLTLKSKDDNARLTLAERAGERSIITTSELEGVYSSIVFTPEIISSAASSTESGPRLRALLYQAATQEKDPQKRAALSVKFLQTINSVALNGIEAHVLGDMIGTIPAADEYNALSGSIARIYIMSGSPETALEWLKQARHAGIGMPGVATELQSLWPLAVLSGLETDSDYGQTLGKWLDVALKTRDPKDDNHVQREQASAMLLLFDAAGFAVPEEDWSRVINPPVPERHTVPSAVLLDRLRAASVANRRGETVLISLLLSGGNFDEPSFLSTLAVIRALRLTGLSADASLLARETAAVILAPPGKL